MKPKAKCALAVLAFIITGAAFFMSCASSRTMEIPFPPSDKLFVTLGDDPGSESNKPYIPKGYFVHTSTEYYLPIPILGLIVFGNAEPQYVFYKKVIPEIRSMGGDALIGTSMSVIPRPPAFFRFLGFPNLLPIYAQTVIAGQAVKR